MKNTLLTCLLAFATLLQAQGSASRILTATGSARHLVEGGSLLPDGKAPGAQDTSRFGRQRMFSELVVASVQPKENYRVNDLRLLAQPDSTAVLLSKAPDFDPENASLPADLAIVLRRPAAPLGRRTYRTRLVRTSRWGSHREAVEILTCTYAGPLVLALLPGTATTPSQVFAGPGYDPEAALRPLELTPITVLRLCGDRAPQVQAYARLYNLHFEQATDVARLLDYYNRLAVVKE